jgi:hypothetical protein
VLLLLLQTQPFMRGVVAGLPDEPLVDRQLVLEQVEQLSTTMRVRLVLPPAVLLLTSTWRSLVDVAAAAADRCWCLLAGGVARGKG